MKTFGTLCLGLILSAGIMGGLMSFQDHTSGHHKAAQKAAAAMYTQTGLTCGHPDAAVLSRTQGAFSLYLECDEGNFVIDYNGQAATITRAK